MWKFNEKGSALVIALMVMVVMSLMAAAYLIMSSFEPESSHNQAVSVSSYYEADALIEEYIHRLLRGPDNDGDGYPDDYATVFGEGEMSENGPTEIVVDTTNANGDSLQITLKTTPPHVEFDKLLDEESKVSSRASLGEENVLGRPLVIDLDGDEVMDVLVASDAGKIRRFIYKFETPSGERFPQWVIKRHDDYEFASVDGAIYGDIIAEDIDLDGQTELIVCNDQNDLYCFDTNGDNKPGFPFVKSGNNPYCWEPSVGNIDRDSQLEIAYSTSLGLFLVDTDGTQIDSIAWPVSNPSLTGGDSLGYTNGHPLLVDVNGGIGMDAKAELVFTDGIFCYCYNEWNGIWQEIWRYPMAIKQDRNTGIMLSGPVLVPLKSARLWVTQPGAYDLDGDGDMEIIITGAENMYETDNDYSVVILDDRNREVNEGDIGRDVNYDGNVLGIKHVPDDVRINLWSSSYLNGDDFYKIQAYRPIACRDVNNDAIPDIFVQTNLDQIFIINARADTIISGWFQSDATLTHYDNGGAPVPQGSYMYVDYDLDDDPDFGPFTPSFMPMNNGINGPASFYNLDNDPELEIAYGTMYNDGKAYLIVLDNKFEDIGGGMQQPKTYERIAIEDNENDPSFNGGVALADLNNDGFLEIIAATAKFGTPPADGLYGNPVTNGTKYLYVHSLRNMQLPKCVITAQVKGRDGSLRTVEAIVRLQVDVSNSSRNSFEVMSWVEK